MKSPFPGMDPYLEPHWLDVHAALIIYTRDQLQSRLPGNLRARVEERVFIDDADDVEVGGRIVHPDVQIVERRDRELAQPSVVASDQATQPATVIIQNEPLTQTYVQIIDPQSGNRVVTSIEFVSPTNKIAGKGRTLYRKKQKQLRAGGVNLVEIDLTRQGQRELVAFTSRIPKRFRTIYLACVWRPSKPNIVNLYAISLRAPLPSLAVPLREQDPEITLELQPLIELAYKNGSYANEIDYSYPLEPPLLGDDEAWSDKLLREAGVRK
jgi:hypothetical protein